MSGRTRRKTYRRNRKRSKDTLVVCKSWRFNNTSLKISFRIPQFKLTKRDAKAMALYLNSFDDRTTAI